MVETKINFYFISILKLLNKRIQNIYLKCMKIKYPVTVLFLIFFFQSCIFCNIIFMFL